MSYKNKEAELCTTLTNVSEGKFAQSLVQVIKN